MPRSTRSTALLVAVTLAVTLAATSPIGATPADGAPVGRAKPAAGVDTPYAGFRTPGTSVAGGYLGARRLDQAVVYRIDPTRRRPAAAFTAATPVSLVDGSGKRNVTLSDTQRAAWIVSKYGAFPRKVQGAAVELALDDLLVGGAYTLRGKVTRQRLATLKNPRRIMELANTMLKGSRQRAGDYQVSIQAPRSVDPGGLVAGRVQVLATASGLGVASLPVTFSLPGGVTQTALTGADGVATASLTPAVAGPVDLTARIDKIPESRLVVLSPTDARASRVVVAQVKAERVLTAPVVVRAQPRVDVVTTVADQRGPAVVNARATLSGGYASGPRAAHATLYGPQPDTASCTGTPRQRVDFTIAPGAPVSIPVSAATSGDGRFAWKVEVDADAFNLATSSCGGSTFNHEKPIFTVAAFQVGRGHPVVATWLPPDYRGNLTVLTYSAPDAGQGPCADNKQLEDSVYGINLAADTNGTVSFDVPTGDPSYYAFRFMSAGVDVCARLP